MTRIETKLILKKYCHQFLLEKSPYMLTNDAVLSLELFNFDITIKSVRIIDFSNCDYSKFLIQVESMSPMVD